MSRPTIKRIHVNQHIIKANDKNICKDQVFTVKNKGKTFIGDRVDINGPSKLVYSPNYPLSCGAKVWIETTSPVLVGRKKMGGFDTVELI